MGISREKTCHILLIDDDPIVRLSIGEGIVSDQYQVTSAADANEAIAVIQKTPCDLAIVDQELPDMTGLALAKILKQEYHTPFVFLSASDDPVIVSEAARLGALGYLVKPVTPRQVIAQLNALLSRSREISNLGKAVEVSGIVSVALGLVMHAQQISREQALARLQAICRPRNQSLKSLSEDLVEQHENYIRNKHGANLSPETSTLLQVK